jgi:hypothetical protein
MPILLQKPRDLAVRPHISGGAHLTFGKEEIVLSPRDAVDFASAVLKSVGVDVKLDRSMFQQ